MKKNLFNWMAMLLVTIVSVFVASCNKGESTPSGQSSEIVNNLMNNKWVATMTGFDASTSEGSTFTEILTVYFTSDHEGVMVSIIEMNSSSGAKTINQHWDFTYSVDGKKVRLSGDGESKLCFDYYGSYMLQGTDMFKASEMTSSDYTYLRDYKAGYHGTDGPINTTIHTPDESEIFYHVADAGNGWYEYYLKFSFYPEDDAYKKGLTKIKFTMWVENGSWGWESNPCNTSNYGKKKISTLNLDMAKQEWFERFRVFSKDDKIYFNYKLEYYNSYNERWYEYTSKRLTFSRQQSSGGNNTDGNIGGHDYVDLGLPSGTLWATCNVGASKPEDYGDYFAWGETAPKTTYNWSTYKYCGGSSEIMIKYCTDSYYETFDNKRVLEPADDAATAKWGEAWQMPSLDQLEELINTNYTTTEWTTVNDVNGRKITSKSNLKSIFLPAAGCRYDTSLSGADNGGYYWSRSLYSSDYHIGYYLYFDSYINTGGRSRYIGQSVRPVRVQTR